MKLIGKVKKIN